MKTIWIACLFFIIAITVQAQQQISNTNPVGSMGDTSKVAVNQRDNEGKRHGLWWEKFPASRGEFAYTAFGTYDHGQRVGSWYKINDLGDLIAIENFRFDMLHGEVKYFEQGTLVCVGHYRGLNPSQSEDTILVVHPVTGEEKLVSIPVSRGSLRHGIWRYYDDRTGRLIREEEYQIDELIHSKNFGLTQADSAYYKERERKMPHNQPLHYKPPKGKGSSLIEIK